MSELADYLQGAAQDIVIDLSFHRYRAGAAPVFCNKVNFNSFLHSCSFRAVHWSVLAEPLADVFNVETMASNARGHASAAANRRVREVDPFAAHRGGNFRVEGACATLG